MAECQKCLHSYILFYKNNNSNKLKNLNTTNVERNKKRSLGTVQYNSLYTTPSITFQTPYIKVDLIHFLIQRRLQAQKYIHVNQKTLVLHRIINFHSIQI